MSIAVLLTFAGVEAILAFVWLHRKRRTAYVAHKGWPVGRGYAR